MVRLNAPQANHEGRRCSYTGFALQGMAIKPNKSHVLQRQPPRHTHQSRRRHDLEGAHERGACFLQGRVKPASKQHGQVPKTDMHVAYESWQNIAARFILFTQMEKGGNPFSTNR